jgi:hypothetical protein
VSHPHWGFPCFSSVKQMPRYKWKGAQPAYTMEAFSQSEPNSGFNSQTSTPPNVKLSLCFKWTPRHEDVLEEWRYSSIHSLTSELDGGEWSASRPGRFTPKERAPGTHSVIANWDHPSPTVRCQGLQPRYDTRYGKHAPHYSVQKPVFDFHQRVLNAGMIRSSNGRCLALCPGLRP